MRPSLKLVLPAAAVAAVAAASPLASASASRTRVLSPSATLAGSVLPSVRHSALLGQARPTAPVRVALILRPSHPALLAKLAARSSGRPGLSQTLIDGLFRPAPSVRSAVADYMRSRGFAHVASGFLGMSFTGTAAQADAAFGVTLANYRLASGIGYRAPSGAVHLPASIAPHVLSVDGLSTLPLEQPAGVKHANQQPNTSLNDCAGADNAQNGTGALQPQDLAAANAYDSQPLVTGGERRQRSGRRAGRVLELHGRLTTRRYQTCYGTSVNVHKVSVNGGNRSTAGGDEVALDQEVLAGEAPGLDNI